MGDVAERNEILIDLVKRAQQGDEPAFAQLVRRFASMARCYAYNYVKDFHAAEDITQEAFLEVHRCLPSLREPAAFPAWFRRIMLKHCDRKTRRRSLATVPLDLAAGASDDRFDTARSADLHETRLQIADALDSLPPHERIVAVLFHLNGYNHKEISELLDIPISTIKNRIWSSRMRLQGLRCHGDAGAQADEGSAAPQSMDTVSKLLSRPRLLDIPHHPVRYMWELVQKTWPENEVVSGEEIEDRDDVFGHEREVVEKMAFYLHGKKILRFQMFDVAAQVAQDRQEPLRLMASGRVFQCQDNPAFWVGNEVDGVILEQGTSFSDFREQFAQRLQAVIGPTQFEWLPVGLRFGNDMGQFVVRRGGKAVEIAALGTLTKSAVRHILPNARHMQGIVFGLRLESMAMHRFGIRDTRELWSTTYL